MINYSKVLLESQADTCHVYTYAGMANGDDGKPLEQAENADRSVQVDGTFGLAGNLAIEGSNDGITYYVLTDPQGNSLNFTSGKIEAVTEATRFIRPRVTSGDGTTNLTVNMLVRRQYK